MFFVFSQIQSLDCGNIGHAPPSNDCEERPIARPDCSLNKPRRDLDGLHGDAG
jgi:hypothetical protein